MSSAVAARLRDMRYKLPEQIGHLLPYGGIDSGMAACETLARQGVACSLGYFARDDDPPVAVAQQYCRLAETLSGKGFGAIAAVKAPQLGFDEGFVREIAGHGLSMVFDAHAHHQAGEIHRLAACVQAGVALPARWRRSREDAEQLRGACQRVRLVKGEWADPLGDRPDINTAYLDLVLLLAGRTAPVAIATHDPELAKASLAILKEAGTPVELEQLRGLPRKRTSTIAQELGVPIRIYHAFGPGWWPYALEQVLRRPYLPFWALRDMVGV